MTLAYLKDPAAIYRLSFDTIRRELNVAGLDDDHARIAVRVAHASGMCDIVDDLRFGGDVAAAARCALAARRAVFTDVEMVRVAIKTEQLPPDIAVRCTLNDPRTGDNARRWRTTRSAAAVSAWKDELAGAVVIVGNAPTALFALLELIDAGGPKPAAVFAFPVGFVGAAEAKQELVSSPRGLSFATLLGRRGGSAMAAAAFNAILIGAGER